MMCKKQAQGNIFAWATGELSQDAVLCWLFDSLRTRGKYASIAKALLIKMGIPKNAEITDMNVFRQCYHIDFILHFKVDGEDRVIIVEDKINAALYNDISGYIQNVIECGLPDDFKPQKNQVIACVVRTGDGNENFIENEKWKTISRKDVLDVLLSNKQTVESSEILSGFYDNLVKWEQGYNSYLLSDGSRRMNRDGLSRDICNSWKGFYDVLLGERIVTKWHYVPNANGGFMCACFPEVFWTDSGASLFMIFDSSSGNICLKVGEVERDKSNVRNNCVQKLENYKNAHKDDGISNLWKKPNRYGCGTYMTYAVILMDNWLKDTLDETIEFLKNLSRWHSDYCKWTNASDSE